MLLVMDCLVVYLKDGLPFDDTYLRKTLKILIYTFD